MSLKVHCDTCGVECEPMQYTGKSANGLSMELEDVRITATRKGGSGHVDLCINCYTAAYHNYTGK